MGTVATNQSNRKPLILCHVQGVLAMGKAAKIDPALAWNLNILADIADFCFPRETAKQCQELRYMGALITCPSWDYSMANVQMVIAPHKKKLGAVPMIYRVGARGLVEFEAYSILEKLRYLLSVRR